MFKYKKDRAWAFLDVLIGLFLTAFILIVLLGSIAWTAYITKQSEKRMLEIIERRNEQAVEQSVEYTKEIFKE